MNGLLSESSGRSALNRGIMTHLHTSHRLHRSPTLGPSSGRSAPRSGRIRRCILALVAVVLSGATVAANDLWVDRNSYGGQCSDGRSRQDVSVTAPWCTIGVAGNRVQPGDVVYVREGLYTEILTDHPQAWNAAVLQVVISGTQQAPILWKAFPGETVTLGSGGGAEHGILAAAGTGFTPRHVVVEGFVVEGFPEVGVMITGASDITLRKLDVSGCRWGAIGSIQSNSVTIESSSIHDNALEGWTSAISLWECTGENILRGNFIWANTDEDWRESEGHGIILDYCESTASALVENNVISDNEGWCINVFFSSNATVRNNTCYRNSRERYDGTGEILAVGNEIAVHNNILVARYGTQAFQMWDGGNPDTIVSDFNIFWSPETAKTARHSSEFRGITLYANEKYGLDENTIEEDPKLLAPSFGDFRLSSESPAIDSATDSMSPAFDSVGQSRPLDGDRDGRATSDRGAYEYNPLIRNRNDGVDRRIRPQQSGKESRTRGVQRSERDSANQD